MGVHLDRTAISELTRLFHGSDIGVHGYVLADAKLAGPLSKLDITGDLNISDVHRWDLMPAPGEGWTLNYRGRLDLNGHHLELATVSDAGSPIRCQWSSGWTIILPLQDGRVICNFAIFPPRHWSKPRGISERHFPRESRWKAKWKAGLVIRTNRAWEGSWR